MLALSVLGPLLLCCILEPCLLFIFFFSFFFNGLQLDSFFLTSTTLDGNVIAVSYWYLYIQRSSHFRPERHGKKSLGFCLGFVTAFRIAADIIYIPYTTEEKKRKEKRYVLPRPTSVHPPSLPPHLLYIQLCHDKKWRCMFTASVVVGRPYVTQEGRLPYDMCPPQGYDAVIGEVRNTQDARAFGDIVQFLAAVDGPGYGWKQHRSDVRAAVIWALFSSKKKRGAVSAYRYDAPAEAEVHARHVCRVPYVAASRLVECWRNIGVRCTVVVIMIGCVFFYVKLASSKQKKRFISQNGVYFPLLCWAGVDGKRESALLCFAMLLVPSRGKQKHGVGRR